MAQLRNLILTACAVSTALVAGCQAERRSAVPTAAAGLPEAAAATATPARPPGRPAAMPPPRTFRSPKHTVYRIRTEPDDADRDVVAPMALRAAPGGDAFQGTARKVAKLSIAPATVEPFTDLQALIGSLPKDAKMIAHSPPIKDTASSDRVKEEKRNVRLHTFLYAASKENDNDFHLILGGSPGTTPKMFMTMELSGLPPATSASFAKLKAARAAFKTFFGSQLPGSGYDFYDPPIPVDIEGSLFFDITHATGGKPGPKKLRKDIPTIWEVHPITSIVLEP